MAKSIFSPNGMALAVSIFLEGRVFFRGVSQDSLVKERATALEIWQYSKENVNAFDLEFLGIARLVLNVMVESNSIYVELACQSENGEFKLNFSDLINGYAIVENFWIPFDASEVESIQELLPLSGGEERIQLKLGPLYTAIAEGRKKGIRINFKEEELSNYITEKDGLHKAKLALSLYPYQEVGVNWLTSLYEEGIGALLCDEMGLGKTAQAFGLISNVFDTGNRRILIVTPASLTINWERELIKFAPHLRIYRHVGSDRERNPSEFSNHPIVLTTYDLVVRDRSLIGRGDWDLIVCDESQALKNDDSKRHIALKSLSATAKVLLTGTPIENSLSDLRSLADIVRDGVLGTRSAFDSLIDDDYHDAIRISRHVSPLILRRLVKDVLTDLPELIEIDEPIIPTKTFAQFYENARLSLIPQTEGASPLTIVGKLQQVCCYPKLIDENYTDAHDAKILRLLEILISVRNTNSEKVVIFSTYTASINFLNSVIKRHLSNPYIGIIDGRLSPMKRQETIDYFQQIEGFAILIIQPVAGGIGLNITSANHVIHFNRQWNPALERQATARVYRRGQDLPVFVHKMYYLGTVEEVIDSRLEFKEELADYGLNEAESEGDLKDIDKALRISPIFQQQIN